MISDLLYQLSPSTIDQRINAIWNIFVLVYRTEYTGTRFLMVVATVSDTPQMTKNEKTRERVLS